MSACIPRRLITNSLAPTKQTAKQTGNINFPFSPWCNIFQNYLLILGQEITTSGCRKKLPRAEIHQNNQPTRTLCGGRNNGSGLRRTATAATAIQRQLSYTHRHYNMSPGYVGLITSCRSCVFFLRWRTKHLLHHLVRTDCSRDMLVGWLLGWYTYASWSICCGEPGIVISMEGGAKRIVLSANNNEKGSVRPSAIQGK